jgi:hypothetical protein
VSKSHFEYNTYPAQTARPLKILFYFQKLFNFLFMSLSDLLSGSLTPDNIAAIASRMGVDNAQAKKAL